MTNDESPPLSALQRSTRDDDEDEPEPFSESAHKEDMRNASAFDEYRAVIRDSDALDAIAEILQDPEWGVGMLEDIANLVVDTGRSTANKLDEDGNAISTWDRH